MNEQTDQTEHEHSIEQSQEGSSSTRNSQPNAGKILSLNTLKGSQTSIGGLYLMNSEVPSNPGML